MTFAYEKSLSFDILGSKKSPGVQVTVIEDKSGGLLFTVEVLSTGKMTADLRGLFFNLNNNKKLAGLTYVGPEVTYFDTHNVIDLGEGVNMQGAASPFDVGLKFGGPGTPHGYQVQIATFTLTNTEQNLSLDDIANVNFGARVMSSGGNGSSKLVTQAPAAPDSVDDEYKIFEDGAQSPAHNPTGIVFQVLDNDTDADGDTLSVIDFRNVSHGTLEIIDGNDEDDLIGDALLYTPDADYSGPDSFEYLISDNNGGKDFASVKVAITAVADLPGLSYEILTNRDINGVALANQMILRVTATQTDTDGSEFIDRIVIEGLGDDVTIDGAIFDPDSYEPTQIHDFLITLPANKASSFDLKIKAVSQEKSNADEETAEVSVHIETSYQEDYQEFNWYLQDESTSSFVYDDYTDLKGPTTKGTWGVAKGGDANGFGAGWEFTAGIEEHFALESGTLNVEVDASVNLESFYNSSTNVMEIRTCSPESLDARWELVDPEALVELSAILKIMFDAWCVNPFKDFSLSDLISIPTVDIDATFLSFDNSSVPDGLFDFSKTALVNDKGEFPAMLDFMSVFYQRPENTNGKLTEDGIVKASLFEYEFDLDELAWNLFELVKGPSLKTPEGNVNPDWVKLTAAGFAFDLNLNPLNLEAKLPGTGLFMDIEMLDFDVIVDWVLERVTVIDASPLYGSLTWENGKSTELFLIGDTQVFENASFLDTDGDGDIEYTLNLFETGTVSHTATLIPEGSFEIWGPKGSGGYDGILGTFTDSFNAGSIYTTEFSAGRSVNISDDEYGFEFSDTMASTAITLVGSEQQLEVVA